MNVLSHRASMQKYIQFLADHRIKHSITYTNRTFKVVSNLGTRVFMSGEISKRGLGFMQQVFNQVKLNINSLQHLNKDYDKLGLERMRFSKMPDGRIENIVEIDIEKAYWNAAHKLEIISDTIYETGMENKYKKVELLACLGGLAKDKRMRVFNGEKYSRGILITDSKETRFLWDAISFEVDKAIKACEKIAGSDFLFYWTDAIFIKNNNKTIANVLKTLSNHGFSCKRIPIEYLINNNSIRKTIVFSKENKSHAKKPLLDDAGNYGRVFTLVTGAERKKIIKKIRYFLSAKKKVKKIIHQIKVFRNDK